MRRTLLAYGLMLPALWALQHGDLGDDHLCGFPQGAFLRSLADARRTSDARAETGNALRLRANRPSGAWRALRMAQSTRARDTRDASSASIPLGEVRCSGLLRNPKSSPSRWMLRAYSLQRHLLMARSTGSRTERRMSTSRRKRVTSGRSPLRPTARCSSEPGEQGKIFRVTAPGKGEVHYRNGTDARHLPRLRCAGASAGGL